jgi:hypothetical protein
VSEGFFGRWSRRKREAGQDLGEGRVENMAQGEVPPLPAAPVAASEVAISEAPTSDQADAAPAQLPTLDDVGALTSESDFQPFMQRGVGVEVRNAAMKKLFADPHFNVMDGLDIYIGDYSQPDPMPAGMLGQMASAQFLKLVPEAAPDVDPQPVGTPQVVAQSPEASAPAATPSHDHTDLQLQPDSAPADPHPRSDPR